MHIAAYFGYERIAELLLKNGANVNARDDYRKSPLHKATIQEEENAAEVLVKYGANINAKDKMGYTPLHIATNDGQSILDNVLLLFTND